MVELHIPETGDAVEDAVSVGIAVNSVMP